MSDTRRAPEASSADAGPVGSVSRPSFKRTLTFFGFFAITASMVMTVYEYPSFASSGFQLVFFLIIVVLPTLQLGFANPKIGAFIALSMYTSAFVAEAIRSGINGVPIGQAEAARSVGLNFGQTVQLIILPQALRMVVPPMINVLIALTKNTSVAGGFAVVELFAVSKGLANQHGNAVIQILLGIAACYLVITIPLGQVAARIERKVAMQR